MMDIDVKELSKDVLAFATEIKNTLYKCGVIVEIRINGDVALELIRGRAVVLIRIDSERKVVELKISKPRGDVLGYIAEDELLNFLYLIEIAKSLAKAFAEELSFTLIPDLYSLHL